MSTDAIKHLTRKAAGKIKIMNCNNMQGRQSPGQCRDRTCMDSSDQTAGRMEFQPLTSKVTTEAVLGFYLSQPQVTLKKGAVSETERHWRAWDTLDSERKRGPQDGR